MAELVDALDLGSSGLIRGGSSPPSRTRKKFKRLRYSWPLFFWGFTVPILYLSVERVQAGQKSGCPLLCTGDNMRIESHCGGYGAMSSLGCNGSEVGPSRV